MAARRLGDGEQRLWFESMREVRPLRGRAPDRATGAPPDEKPPAVGPDALAAALPPVPRPPSRPAARVPHARPPVEIGARQGGLDDTSWRMLGNGRLRPQRRLDLHGQRAQTAFQLLHAFLVRAQSERLRCVEIITGAGSGPEGGILRRELPLWLSRPDLRPMVLAAVHPHARNVGSVRLLLRRKAP